MIALCDYYAVRDVQATHSIAPGSFVRCYPAHMAVLRAHCFFLLAFHSMKTRSSDQLLNCKVRSLPAAANVYTEVRIQDQNLPAECEPGSRTLKPKGCVD